MEPAPGRWVPTSRVVCTPPLTLLATLALRVDALDHAELRAGGPGDPLRLACGVPNPMDPTLYRTVFRGPQPVAGGLAPTQLSVGRQLEVAFRWMHGGDLVPPTVETGFGSTLADGEETGPYWIQIYERWP